MNCQQTTRLLSDTQERQLTIREYNAVRIHVLTCSGCRNFGKHIDILREISQSYAKGSENHEEAL